MASFNPPLGSTRPDVLADNATRLDKLINGSIETVNDRAGNPLKTWTAIESGFDTIVSSLDSAGVITVPDIASGLAATTDGKYFRVILPDGFYYYRNNSGAAVLIIKTLGSDAVKFQTKASGVFDANETQFRRAAAGDLIWSGHIQEWSDFRSMEPVGVHVSTFSNMGASSAETRIGLYSDDKLQSVIYLPRLSSRLDNNNLYCPFDMFKLSDCELHRVAGRDENAVRAQFVIPAEKMAIAGSIGNVFYDLFGIFTPAITIAEIESATSGNRIGKSAALNIFQIVVSTPDITAAGYDYLSDGQVEAFIRLMASRSLFLGYTGIYKDITGVSDYFTRLVPAGKIALKQEGVSADQIATLSVFRKSEPVSQPVGLEQYKSLSIENDSAYGFTSFPVEGKVKFSPGEVKPGSKIIIRSEDGRELPAQFCSEWHPNPRHRSDMGRYTDGSVASGSILFIDDVAAGASKTYDMFVYAVPGTMNDEPIVTHSQTGLNVKMGGYTYAFTNNGGLGSITPDGEAAISVQLQLWVRGVVGGVITEAASNQMYTQNVISTGPVFAEVEQICYSRETGTLAKNLLRHIVRYRIFNNGRVFIQVVNQAVSDIPVSILAGVYHRLTLQNTALTIDDEKMFSGYLARSNGRVMTATLIRAHGDQHRDGTDYGPTRSGYFEAVNPSPTTTRITGGWRVTSTTDLSFNKWPVGKDYVWTGEYFIDMESDQSTSKDKLTALYARPVGFFGSPEWPVAKREKLISRFEAFCAGSMDWFNSAAAGPYGGGPERDKEFHAYAWEIWLRMTRGKGSLSDIYTRFVARCNASWGGFNSMGNGYLTGALVLQFSSRLTIPVYEWLYKAAVSEQNPEIQAGLKSSIASYAQGIVTKWDAIGRIPLNGSTTQAGNSNATATAMRILALAIYMGQDTTGKFRTTFDALNGLLSGDGYNLIRGVWTDALNDTLVRTNWFAYQVYAINNYLLACDLISVTPSLDMTNYMIQAQTGLGGFKEIFYCISESRRGQFNTATHAMYPLLRRKSASTACAAEAVWGEVERQVGARVGMTRRMYQFDGVTSGVNSRYEVSFNVTVLSEVMMKFWFDDRL